MDDETIMKQVYDIAYGKYTEAIRNDLDLESGFARITEYGGLIGLIKTIKHICYKFQSREYSPKAVHDVLRKFYVQA